jgi:hypothetical protein
VIDGNCDERVALGLYVGVEVIVGDLGDDHVAFGVPSEYGMRKTEASTETSQESGDSDHG